MRVSNTYMNGRVRGSGLPEEGHHQSWAALFPLAGMNALREQDMFVPPSYAHEHEQFFPIGHGTTTTQPSV